MRRISSLHKAHTDTIYIVGTGPSLRAYPLNYFHDKYTIGLNQAYKLINPTLSITIHPYLIPVNHNIWNTIWLTKKKPHDPKYQEHVSAGNYSRFILFNNENNYETFRDCNGDRLFVGAGIQTGAIHLGCILGAKYLILVGCDFCDIENEHHALDQHIEFKGYDPKDVYKEYYYFTEKCRRMALDYYGVEVFSMSPCIGFNQSEDWKRIKQHRNLPELVKPKDITMFPRKGEIVTEYIP